MHAKDAMFLIVSRRRKLENERSLCVQCARCSTLPLKCVYGSTEKFVAVNF